MKSLPQLRAISLWSPVSANVELDVLADLPNLRTIFIADALGTGQLLGKLPPLPQVEKLILQDCRHFSDGDLAHLNRLQNLKQLHVVQSGSLSEDGIRQLLRKQNLKTIFLWKSTLPMTDQMKESLIGASPDLSLRIDEI